MPIVPPSQPVPQLRGYSQPEVCGRPGLSTGPPTTVPLWPAPQDTTFWLAAVCSISLTEAWVKVRAADTAGAAGLPRLGWVEGKAVAPCGPTPWSACWPARPRCCERWPAPFNCQALCWPCRGCLACLCLPVCSFVRRCWSDGWGWTWAAACSGAPAGRDRARAESCRSADKSQPLPESPMVHHTLPEIAGNLVGHRHEHSGVLAAQRKPLVPLTPGSASCCLSLAAAPSMLWKPRWLPLPAAWSTGRLAA